MLSFDRANPDSNTLSFCGRPELGEDRQFKKIAARGLAAAFSTESKPICVQMIIVVDTHMMDTRDAALDTAATARRSISSPWPGAQSPRCEVGPSESCLGRTPEGARGNSASIPHPNPTEEIPAMKEYSRWRSLLWVKGEVVRIQSPAEQVLPLPGHGSDDAKSELGPWWAKSSYKPIRSFHLIFEKLGFLASTKTRTICLAVGILLVMLLTTALTAVLLLGQAGRSRADVDLTVDLGYSKYRGFNGPNGVSQWFGIRYAAPPVGDLRFRAPQDPAINTAVQEANKHGPLCHTSPSNSLDTSKQEDCLFLDVYAPSAGKGKHPVLVFFQGGGFNGLANPNQDATSLIKAGDHDMVVVTFNYRCGPYGFLASKEVKADGALNAGLLDQRKVLQWVQKHIHLFGGDPKHVTIAGGSAGGASVKLHLTAYGGRDDNLFHAAAAESQSFGVELTVEESQYQYDALVKRVKCDTAANTLKCLRGVSIKTLAENNPNVISPGGGGGTPLYMWSSTMDGVFTPNFTYNLILQGKFVKVPVIFGDCTNEGTVFTPKSIANATQMGNFLKNNFPKVTPYLGVIELLYPSTPQNQFPSAAPYWRPAADAYGDMRYTCPGIFLSVSYPNHSVNESWNYRWDVVRPENAKSGLGVTHVADQGAIWGNAGPVEAPLSPMMQAYWTSFIRTKNPNTHKLPNAPEWGEFLPKGQIPNSPMRRIHFVNDVKATAMETVDDNLQLKCTWLNAIGGRIGQ
ncbi:Carboxylic ester hydrolase [Venustampulla echinocandica]|uniref:Carboxylic ester hydrolase n=1 Tax=Venustampulla echinocandica TaxID=2656787 RepID=A0A370TTP8_9HELO|nr:Carboxylic ester hydrolase [Venustampulla echinocandica]RDL38909.1 Carboxylic ester hydrolase [Venustampulla echinocandica]